MMWKFLDSVVSSTTKYTLVFGKLWYILVFVFRLLVIVSVGQGVYDDERGNFLCQIADRDGCENMCFDQFIKISHLRFWSFQLLAVITPTIFFHFYCMHVTSVYEKVKQTKQSIADKSANLKPSELEKLYSNERRLGKVRVRTTHVDGTALEIPLTKKIEAAYIATLLLRLISEAVFIYIGFSIFNIKDGEEDPTSGIINFMWMKVPSMYNCKNSGNSDILVSCFHHLSEPGVGIVTCWVSRPAEKTIFLRYMNIVTIVCCVVTLIELFHISVKLAKSTFYNAKRNNGDDEWIDLEEFTQAQRSEAAEERTRDDSRNVKKPATPSRMLSNEITTFQPSDEEAEYGKDFKQIRRLQTPSIATDDDEDGTAITIPAYIQSLDIKPPQCRKRKPLALRRLKDHNLPGVKQFMESPGGRRTKKTFSVQQLK